MAKKKAAPLVAQVKDENKQLLVTAFGGRQYSKVDWRQVPAGEEAAAKAHPMLDTKIFKAPAKKKAAPKKKAAKPSADAIDATAEETQEEKADIPVEKSLADLKEEAAAKAGD